MSDDICGEIKNDGEKCTFAPKHSDGKCGHHTDTVDHSRDRQSKLEKNPEIVDLMFEEMNRGATINEALSEVEEKTGIYISRGAHDQWFSKGQEDDADELYKKYRSKVRRARTLGKRTDRKDLKEMCKENDDTRTWWEIHKEQYGDLYDGDEMVAEDSENMVRQRIPEDFLERWHGRNK